jgi:putative acetyltransferase
MIRPYAEQDVDALIEVWRAASQIATPFLSAEFLAQEADNIRNLYLPNAETWVIDSEDTVAGFIALIGDEVGAIFVHPNYQEQSLGRALMDHAVSLRKSLFLDVFKENAVGRRFYDRYGFQYENEHTHEETGQQLLRLVFTPDDIAT